MDESLLLRAGRVVSWQYGICRGSVNRGLHFLPQRKLDKNKTSFHFANVIPKNLTKMEMIRKKIDESHMRVKEEERKLKERKRQDEVGVWFRGWIHLFDSAYLFGTRRTCMTLGPLLP